MFVTTWTAVWQTSLSIINSQSLLKLMSIEFVMLSNHLILFHPLLLPPSNFPTIRVFPNESVICITWPKYWSFCFIISPSNKYLGLISFRMDCLDLLAVQGTLKSLLLGASVRNSAHGKSHEEGGLAYAKAWSSFRKPPVPEHLPPKPEFVYFTYALTYSSGFMGVSPPSTFLSEKELTCSSS